MRGSLVALCNNIRTLRGRGGDVGSTHTTGDETATTGGDHQHSSDVFCHCYSASAIVRKAVRARARGVCRGRGRGMQMQLAGAELHWPLGHLQLAEGRTIDCMPGTGRGWRSRGVRWGRLRRHKTA